MIMARSTRPFVVEAVAITLTCCLIAYCDAPPGCSWAQRLLVMVRSRVNVSLLFSDDAFLMLLLDIL